MFHWGSKYPLGCTLVSKMSGGAHPITRKEKFLAEVQPRSQFRVISTLSNFNGMSVTIQNDATSGWQPLYKTSVGLHWLLWKSTGDKRWSWKILGLKKGVKLSLGHTRVHPSTSWRTPVHSHIKEMRQTFIFTLDFTIFGHSLGKGSFRDR